MSGSSGRLVVARAKEEKERAWPGRVFEEEGLSYEEAMLKFVAASHAKEAGPEQKEKEEEKGLAEPRSAQDTSHLLKKEAKQLQKARHQGREQRNLEDRAWKPEKREKSTRRLTGHWAKWRDENKARANKFKRHHGP